MRRTSSNKIELPRSIPDTKTIETTGSAYISSARDLLLNSGPVNVGPNASLPHRAEFALFPVDHAFFAKQSVYVDSPAVKADLDAGDGPGIELDHDRRS